MKLRYLSYPTSKRRNLSFLSHIQVTCHSAAQAKHDVEHDVARDVACHVACHVACLNTHDSPPVFAPTREIEQTRQTSKDVRDVRDRRQTSKDVRDVRDRRV